jgi:hypothetical protein
MHRLTLVRALVVALLVVGLTMPVALGGVDESQPPGGCPPGTIPRPPELNPVLGPCVLDMFVSNPFMFALFDVDPFTCPPGWAPAAPPLNPQLGCLPGSATGGG